jgi:spore maturation protein CgeB
VRWLICGAWEWDWYEPACARALEALGESVTSFSWTPLLKRGISARIENKWTVSGLATSKMNRALLKSVEQFTPDVVLVWRGVHVLPETIRSVRGFNRPLIVSYNNDDPFGPLYSEGSLHLRRLWRTFKRGIPEYDLHFVYREVTRADFLAAGARKAHVLLPYYVPEYDKPISLSSGDAERFGCDVVFVGHYEDDGRVEYIRSLVRAGIKVKLFGTGWDSDSLGDLATHFGSVRPLRGEEYRKALVAARFSLCFLSRLNRDEYTRRCFEIPACRAALLSERTEALQRLFEDGREAIYFSDSTELVSRVKMLLLDPDQLDAVRNAGFERVRRDGHSVYNRMNEMIDVVRAERTAREDPSPTQI